MKMQERIAEIMEWLGAIPAPIQAFIAAFIIAPLRVIYDQSETTWERICLEALLCGCIGYGVASGAGYFGIPDGVGAFIGSFVGFVGVVKFRELANKYLGTKLK